MQSWRKKATGGSSAPHTSPDLHWATRRSFPFSFPSHVMPDRMRFRWSWRRFLIIFILGWLVTFPFVSLILDLLITFQDPGCRFDADTAPLPPYPPPLPDPPCKLPGANWWHGALLLTTVVASVLATLCASIERVLPRIVLRILFFAAIAWVIFWYVIQMLICGNLTYLPWWCL
jgi:hypothetical protein